MVKWVLVIRRISGPFINTLTGGQKFSVFNTDNLTQQTQMNLSVQGKTFSRFFFLFFSIKF